MKRLIPVLLLLSLAGLLVVSCGRGEEGAEAASAKAEPVEFIIANGAEPESLDPHMISGVPEHRIYESLFEGLLIYDPKTAEAIPGLAESWDVSEDRTVYTFKLRKTSWSDGTPITAQTVRDSWLRELNPDTAAPYAWFPAMFIKGAAEYNSGDAGPEAVKIEAVDDYTFKMELVGPLPYVLGALPHYSFAVVPLHAIEKFGDQWTRPENFVGNGPFLLKEWAPQERIVAAKNEKYWDAGAVKLDSVVYLPIDDLNTAHNMYLNEEADWSTDIPQDQLEAARQMPDFKVDPQLATYYYSIQTQKAPFDDPRVRKALSMAIDRQKLVDQVSRAGEIPTGAMVPPMTGYAGIKGTTFNLDEAKKLLAEAGYPDGKGFPKFELSYNTHENHRKIAEYIQQQWIENLGIQCELANYEWKTFLPLRREGDYQVARDGWVGDYQDPNTFLDMFITGGAMNNSQWSNKKFDELINKAAQMNPGEERFKVLMDAEEILVTQDQAVVPLYHYVNKNMIDTEKWGGWYQNVMDFHPTKNIFKK